MPRQYDRLQVRVSPAERAAVEAEAARRNVSAGALVRDLLAREGVIRERETAAGPVRNTSAPDAMTR